MWLDIGVFGVVYLAKTLDREILYLVNYLTTTIIPLAGVTLGVFVGADGTHGLEDMVADIVLRRNQFKSGRLPFLLVPNQVKNLEILFHIS